MEKRANKKKLIIVILIVIILFVLRAVVGSNTTSFVDCEKSESNNGWNCYSRSHANEESLYPQQISKSKLHELEQKCLSEGGKVDKDFIGDPGFRGTSFKCLIPYSDAGQTCSNSYECQGSCKYEKGLANIPEECTKAESSDGEFFYTCPEKILGICTEKTMSSDACSGDIWSEVVDNIIYSNNFTCLF